MNFSWLSPLGFAAGLAGLAATLFFLQRLRVRHRQVDVVTTMFWREAVHDTRARVFVQRFRHPWAYALLLAICALLWTAFAGPRTSEAPQSRTVFVLDSSAHMAHGTRFDEAKARLLEYAAAAPRDERHVIASGATRELLLQPGEELLLLEARLESLEPSAAPGSLDETLNVIGTSSPLPTRVVILGDAPLPEREALGLPETVTIERAFSQAAESVPSRNSGITALGVAQAASGAWDRVDVLVEVAGQDVSTNSVGWTLDGATLEQVAEQSNSGEATTRFTLRDLPAQGGLFEAKLAARDDLDLDDSAQLVLPDRPLLQVAVSPAVPETVRVVLEADPAVRIVSDAADVCVRTESESFGGDLPALVLTQATEGSDSFFVQYDGEQAADVVLSDVVGVLALNEIDATALAQSTQRAISVGAEVGERREVRVWESLITEEYDFIDSRAFPMFIAGSLRWLVNTGGFPEWVVAGEPVRNITSLQTADGRAWNAAGLEVELPSAGRFETSNGQVLAASLAAPAVTRSQAEGGVLDPMKDVASSGLDLATWILILAALLLLFEWRQLRTGRIP